MRVTQSMLSNSNLKYISKNYDRLGTIQDQLMTGKKITKPSDDPVVAMKGMRYRTQVVEVKQFQRNLNEAFTWMDNADAALEETTQVLHRIRELTVQASNDSYDPVARANISKEIEKLQEHLVSLAETKVGDSYIFNGTDTSNSPINTNEIDMDMSKFVDWMKVPGNIPKEYEISFQGQTYKYNVTSGDFIVEPMVDIKNPAYAADPTNEPETITKPTASINIDPSTGKIKHRNLEALEHRDGELVEVSKELNDTKNLVLSKSTSVSSNTQDVRIEVMKGVTIPINIRSQNAYSTNLFGGIESIKKMLNDPTTTGTDITKALNNIDAMTNDVVATRAELGAQVNRVEMVNDRLLQQEVVAKQTLSDNEDIDFEQVIIDLTVQESLHRASLAVGARIIQPTLMDFLR